MPVASFALPGERGRLVFSSSEDPIRATGTPVLTRDSSLVSMLVSSVSGVAESLFATLFPSDCRLCGAPLVKISRLPVCRPSLSEVRPITGGVSWVCGERVFSPYAVSAGETRCGLCRRLEPPFVRAVAYGREILLVDDVFTTGTTVSECACVLRRAGASRVFVATVARTLKADADGIDMARSFAEDERTVAATG